MPGGNTPRAMSSEMASRSVWMRVVRRAVCIGYPADAKEIGARINTNATHAETQRMPHRVAKKGPLGQFTVADDSRMRRAFFSRVRQNFRKEIDHDQGARRNRTGVGKDGVDGPCRYVPIGNQRH